MVLDKKFWQDRNVLLTGATGFLGSWMAKKLNQLDSTVVGLVRDIYSTTKDDLFHEAVRDFTVLGALEDYDTLLRTVNEYEIDTVFHLGAQAIVGTANRNPRSTFEANIRGTWNLLEACRQVSSVKRIVVASSDKAYGEQPKLPYEEDMPLKGSYPYDVSKSCMDLIAQTYHNTYQSPVCITRCGNFFGGGDLNFNRIVPGTIRSVIKNESPIIRSDGTFIRDYIYVKGAVLFYLYLAQSMEDTKIHGQAFNCSNEIHMSVLEITHKILQLMDRKDLEPNILGEVKGETPLQYLSAAKAKKWLKWSPEYTIDEDLSETIDWYENYFRKKKPFVRILD